MSIPQKKIKKYANSQQNTGKIEKANAKGFSGSPDKNLVKLSARINKDKIEDIKFSTNSSQAIKALTNYLISEIKGKDIFYAAKINDAYIKKFFGKLYKKDKSLYSPLDALHNLISDYLLKIEEPICKLNKNTVAVSMSGGIDSSVTAKIIKDSGYSPIGITFKVLPGNFNLDDINYAKRVCSLLDIPHFVINLVDQFKKIIIDKFYKEYLIGRTPNPCVDCNKFIKFGTLLEKAKILGANYIASGHYCKIAKQNSHYIIKKGIDLTKDQSYMLWRLTQNQLKHMLCPLGTYHKKEIKKMGKKLFPFLKNRLESQDVCFIQAKNYHNLIDKKNNITKGKILNTKGEILGAHKGYPFYTIGQRKGLGISHAKPLYVKDILPKKNIIIVGKKKELYQKNLIVKKLNFTTGSPPADKFKAEIKIRYNTKPAKGAVKIIDSKGFVEFDETQLAITPGQSAVFYNKDILLGGGIIIK